MEVATTTEDFVLPEGAESLLLEEIGTVIPMRYNTNKQFGLVQTQNGTVYYRSDCSYEYAYEGGTRPVLVPCALEGNEQVTLEVRKRHNATDPAKALYSKRVVRWNPEKIESILKEIESQPVYRFVRTSQGVEEYLWAGRDLVSFRATFPQYAFKSSWLADYRFEKYLPDTDEWSPASSNPTR